MRRLAALKLVKLVKTTPRRGAMEHYYRAEARPHVTDEGWAEAPEIVKRAMVGAMLAPIAERVNAAAAEGGFSRQEAHISRTPLRLDEQGWQAVARELATTLERIDRIHAEAEKRLAKTDHADELSATAVLMLFEGGESAEPKPAPKRGRSARRSKARVASSPG